MTRIKIKDESDLMTMGIAKSTCNMMIKLIVSTDTYKIGFHIIVCR